MAASKAFSIYQWAIFRIVVFGMVVSYFSVSKILDYFLIRYELYVWSLFFGMILGSIYYINNEFKIWYLKTRIALIIGIALGVGISF